MKIKMRRLKNLPVFDVSNASIAGRVVRAVVGDDFKLAYIVIEKLEGGRGVLKKNDFILGPDALRIKNRRSIKSYIAGEELSMNRRKLGDTVFDSSGKELGVISDFILAADSSDVQGIEVSSGTIQDMLQGRGEISLEQIDWRTDLGAVARTKGSDRYDD